MKIHKVNIALFVLILCFFSLYNVLDHPKPIVSVYENRVLQPRPLFSVPALFSGRFFREFETRFADTFVWRDQLVQASNGLSKLRGFKSDVSIVTHSGDNTAETGDGEYSQGLNGRILLAGDTATFIHRFDPDSTVYYAAAINDFAAQVPATTQVYSLLAPTMIEFLPEKYRSLSAPSDQILNRVHDHLDSEVVPVDALAVMRQHASQYLFFRTDFHWTATGAYYAYDAFMQARGAEPVPLASYEMTEVEGFLGSMHSRTLSKQMEANWDVVQLYHPFVPYDYYIMHNGQHLAPLLNMSHANNKNKYGIFLGGDIPLAKIVTGSKQLGKIMVIKDSYGNAFVPFLIPHYSKIYVVDPRHIKESAMDLIRQEQIDEVLFLNNIMVTESNDFANIIKAMQAK